MALRWVFFLGLAACLAGGEAVAETPLHAIQRLVNTEATILFGKTRPPRRTRVPSGALASSVPLPRLRPTDMDTATTAPPPPDQAVAGPAVVAENEAVPEPRLRPGDDTAVTAQPTLPVPPPPPPPAPETKLASLPPAASPPVEPPSLPAVAGCGTALASLGATALPLAPIVEGECGVPAPVALSALDGGRVDFSTKAIIGCPLAETLATWVRDEVEPAARISLGDELTGLRIADSYTCRTRDGIAGAKMSEHAFGNAIDISAFRIGKRWIAVGDSSNSVADNTFLAAVRKSACGPFTTVLGPGADSYHTSHFHLDLAKRRTAGPSKGLYCE